VCEIIVRHKQVITSISFVHYSFRGAGIRDSNPIPSSHTQTLRLSQLTTELSHALAGSHCTCALLFPVAQNSLTQQQCIRIYPLSILMVCSSSFLNRTHHHQNLLASKVAKCDRLRVSAIYR